MARKFMRLAVLPVAFFVLLAFGGANGQVPPKLDGPLPASPVEDPIPRAIEPAPPQQRQQCSVDDLISQLESLKKQKAQIEEKEKAVAEELKKRLKDQENRLSKLGLIIAPPPVDPPGILLPPVPSKAPNVDAPRSAPK